MFLRELTLTRSHTHMYGTHTQRMLLGYTKSEAALVERPVHLGCKQPVQQPSPLSSPLKVNAIHSVCSRKHGEPSVGQMLPWCRSSWWTDDGPERGRRVRSLGSDNPPWGGAAG